MKLVKDREFKNKLSCSTRPSTLPSSIFKSCLGLLIFLLHRHSSPYAILFHCANRAARKHPPPLLQPPCSSCAQPLPWWGLAVTIVPWGSPSLTSISSSPSKSTRNALSSPPPVCGRHLHFAVSGDMVSSSCIFPCHLMFLSYLVISPQPIVVSIHQSTTPLSSSRTPAEWPCRGCHHSRCGEPPFNSIRPEHPRTILNLSLQFKWASLQDLGLFTFVWRNSFFKISLDFLTFVWSIFFIKHSWVYLLLSEVFSSFKIPCDIINFVWSISFFKHS